VHGLFNISAFYNNFENQQIQLGFNARELGGGAIAPVSPTTAIINAGKSRIYGAEVEAAITPLTGLSFDINYTYLNATIRRISGLETTDPNYEPGQTNIAPGSPLALSPKNKASGTVAYTLPLPSAIGRIVAAGTFTHTDKMLTNYAYLDPTVAALFGGQNLSFIPSTDLLNINLNWNSVVGSPFDIALFATNVADKHYYGFIPGLGSPGNGIETATLGEPRMMGARLKYHFGR
jgi:iron complex outermembrane receptor protein